MRFQIFKNNFFSSSFPKDLSSIHLTFSFMQGREFQISHHHSTAASSILVYLPEPQPQQLGHVFDTIITMDVPVLICTYSLILISHDLLVYCQVQLYIKKNVYGYWYEVGNGRGVHCSLVFYIT